MTFFNDGTVCSGLLNAGLRLPPGRTPEQQNEFEHKVNAVLERVNAREKELRKARQLEFEAEAAKARRVVMMRDQRERSSKIEQRLIDEARKLRDRATRGR